MITYKVVKGAPGYGFFVVAVESGAVVAGPYTTSEQAQAEADSRAQALLGRKLSAWMGS